MLNSNTLTSVRINTSHIYFRLRSHSFVPEHQPVSESDVSKLKYFLDKHRNNIIVLTGAGISTESGIPDYRSKDVGLYARSNHKPITYQEFMKDPEARKRYWTRSFVGWPRFSSVLPNSTHNALQTLEKKRIISCIVTQNVDDLHTKAGSRNIIELHGTLCRVICTNCRNYTVDRHEFQHVLENLNPIINVHSKVIRPDGDVELTENDVSSFNLPNCPKCDGYLKPDVIFFGENVPMKRVEQIKLEIEKCNSILVLGSSLTVYSAYRLILQAYDLKRGLCIINLGSTRGDKYADIKIEAKCGDILPLILPM